MNKSEMLRALARRNGLCDKWYGEWNGSESDQELIDKYLNGLDFCIEHDYPTTDMICSLFDEELLHKNHIYTNDMYVNVHNPKPVVVLNGGTCGEILFDGYAVSSVYVRHLSGVKIKVRDHAIVSISAYDAANVYVDCAESAKAFVYVRTDNAHIQTNGNVLIRG